jgi:hypothetical protein
MTTNAPVIKELYIPEIPNEIIRPAETPIELPQTEPVKVPV